MCVCVYMYIYIYIFNRKVNLSVYLSPSINIHDI